MGTIFAHIYEALSMGYFELTFHRICINEFGETLGQFILKKLVPVSRKLRNTLRQN